MQKVLVTGANRGIGLEFVRQFLHREARVFAACRVPDHASELARLARTAPDRLSILPLEVSRENSIAAFAREISTLTDSLDILVNNAGMLVPGERLGNVSSKALIDSFTVNVAGAFLVTQALEKFLTNVSNAKVINISSKLGSMGQTTEFYAPSYSISKAALNMGTRLLSIELGKKGVTVVSFHPGWVKTDMGGAQAPVTPPESVSGILSVIDRVTIEDNGKFLSYRGEELPW